MYVLFFFTINQSKYHYIENNIKLLCILWNFILYNQRKYLLKFKKSLIPEIIFEIYINIFYKDEKNNNTADKKRKRRRISASKIPGQILIIDNIVNYANWCLSINRHWIWIVNGDTLNNFHSAHREAVEAKAFSLRGLYGASNPATWRRMKRIMRWVEKNFNW